MPIARVLLTATLFACFSIFAVANARALTDEQYRDMLKSSPEYAQAEKKLEVAWKNLKQAATAKDMLGYLEDQVYWVGKERDLEAEELAAPGDDAPRIVGPEGVNTAKYYALATQERAGKIRMLTEQERAGQPLTLGGYLGRTADGYTFTPYPFKLPFKLCSTAEFHRLPADIRIFILKQVNEEHRQVYLTGFFRLPGVYWPDERIKLEVNEGGMSWREQDQYLD